MGGKLGGNAPLAMTCSGPTNCLAVSKYFMLPVSACTAPMLNRTAPEFRRSKSTSSSSVSLSGVVSQTLIASGVPCGMSTGGGTRGSKKPGTPPTTASVALVSLKIRRELSSLARGQPRRRLETRSQNSRKRSMRFVGGLPAMMAELTAPIEMPATQLGLCPALARAS
jgi:hypothetical protein